MSEIKATKAIVALFTVFVFFVLPCVVIAGQNTKSDKEQSQLQNGPKVAGASINTTSSSEEGVLTNDLNNSFNFNSQSGLFIIVGVALFIIGSILVFYLIISDRAKYKKFKY